MLFNLKEVFYELYFSFIAVCLLLIGMSALLSLIMMRIPPLPSTPSVIKKIITQISSTPFSLTITEIGSGYRYMLFRLAKAFPDRKIVGIEISLIPFLFSYMIKILGNFKNVQIIYGNAFTIIKKNLSHVRLLLGI